MKHIRDLLGTFFGWIQSGTNAIKNTPLCIYRIVIRGPVLPIAVIYSNGYNEICLFVLTFACKGSREVETVDIRNVYVPRNGKKKS